MSDVRYRLIFNGFEPGADFKPFLSYLKRDLNLLTDKIQSIMTTPPRVVQEFHTQHSAELTQASLMKIGCMTLLEPVIAYTSVQFVISQKHDKLIKRELSKILRCRTSLVILLVQVESEKSPANLPSMMGPFEDQIAKHFRESDTVIGIDDVRILILGFATDKLGVMPLEGKARRIMKHLLGEDIHITIGYSVFPDEGQAFPKLIYLAGLPRRNEDNFSLPHISEKELLQPSALDSTNTEKVGVTPLQLCFTRARGRIFKRLLNMDPQTLWLGLSQIPQAGQKEFLARLPFNSPLTPALEGLINAPPKYLSDKTAESHFNAIIHQMELEDSIAKRDDLMNKVLSKLMHSEDLPTLPSVATQIFNIASAPNSSGTELANIITRDPALTSKLLKTVNSAFYGNPQKISSVKQAVAFLGTDEIVDIAFGLAVAKVFDVKTLKDLIDPKFLWHHAICTALIAQHLCKRFLPQYRDVGVFTAGLLHDVGKILLIEKFPDMYRQMYTGMAKYDLPFFELEEDHFGMNHAEIGKYLTSRWNLPEALVNAIAFHHQPFSASSHSGLAAVTGLADYLYYRATGAKEHADDVPGHTHWLTVGHWIFLTQLFKDMDTQKLDDMTRDAMTIIEQNQDYLTVNS